MLGISFYMKIQGWTRQPIENWTDGAKGEGEIYELPQKCEFFKIPWGSYLLGS